MDASFEEKSVWMTLLSLIAVYALYFVVAGKMLSEGIRELVAFAPLFAAVVLLQIIVLVVGHVAVAVWKRPEGQGGDERDRIISWKAEHHSSWLLAVGVLAAITAMVFSVENVWTAHLLLMALVLSEILRCSLQLLYYRRGL